MSAAPPEDTTPYHTLAARAVAEYEVRGSRFIGHAAPVDSVDAAKAFIAEVREEHADATHNVPAYRVRGKPPAEWSSDDGEPSGSSGRPILNVLQQQDLVDVVVVVTRYFGGTKLGVGGLVRAYSRGAREALDAAGIVERVPETGITIIVGYEDAGSVRSLLEQLGVPWDVAYAERVTYTARVPAPDAEGIRDRVRGVTSGRVAFG